MALNKCFLDDGKRMYEKLCKMRMKTNQFREQAAIIKKNPTGNVDHLQQMIQQIESLLTQYKADECVMAEVLLRDEVPLWQDCLLMERHITGWDNEQDQMNEKYLHADAHTRRMKATLRSDITKDLPKEIAAFQLFLDANGGRLGGWTDQEHATFLRLRQRQSGKKLMKNSYNYKNRMIIAETCAQPQAIAVNACTAYNDLQHFSPTTEEEKHQQLCLENDSAEEEPREDSKQSTTVPLCSFFHEVSVVLGTRNPEEVKQHDLWWEKLQQLETAKRKAIQNWKEKRLSMKCPSSTEHERNTEKPSYKSALLTSAELEAQKAALDRWREEKTKLAKATALAEEKAAFEVQQARLIQLEKRRNELKERVTEYHSKKQTEQTQLARDLAAREDEERLRRREQLSQSAGRIRQRNENLIAEQKAQKQASKMAEAQRLARIEKALEQQKSQVLARRDPDRLTQWTQGWRLRIEAGQEAVQAHVGLPCGLIHSGRGIPEWRRDI